MKKSIALILLASSLFASEGGLYFNQGISAFYSKDYPKAEALFNKYLETEGENHVALRYLALIALENNALPQAETYLQRAIAAKPDSLDNRLLLADIYGRSGALSKAERELLAVLDYEPLNEQTLAMLAFIAVHDKDYRKASGWYKRLLIATLRGSASPVYLERAYTFLGNYYYHQEDYPAAVNYYAKLLELTPSNLQNLLILGELYKVTGQFSKSIDTLEKLLSQKSDYAPAWESIAESLFIVDRPGYAHAAGKAATLLKEPNQLMNAFIFFHSGNSQEASEAFGTILRANNSRLSAHIGMYRIYANGGERRNARNEAFTVMLLSQRISANELAHEFAHKVLRELDRENHELNQPATQETSSLDPDQVQYMLDQTEFSLSFAGLSENLEKNHAALVYYRNARKHILPLVDAEGLSEKSGELVNSKQDSLREKQYRSLTSEAWLLHRINAANDSRSLALLSKARKLAPEDSTALFISGIVEMETNPESSLEKLTHAVRLAEMHSENSIAPANYYFYLGLAEEKISSFAEAEPRFLKALELEPYNPTYLNYLGYMYSLNDTKLKTAYDLLLRALEDDPDNAAYLDSFGWILYKMGKYELALRQLVGAHDKADREKNPDAVIFYHLAETYFALSLYEQASFFYGKAVEEIATASEKIDLEYLKKRHRESLDKIKQ